MSICILYGLFFCYLLFQLFVASSFSSLVELFYPCSIDSKKSKEKKVVIWVIENSRSLEYGS